MQVTYASIVLVFSSKLKGLQAWNSCSLVLPILEYCCLNKFCIPCQLTFIGSNELYHNLASPKHIKQNLWTLTPSTKCGHPVIGVEQMGFCILIRFLWNSGLKWDQFKCTISCSGCCGASMCMGGAGWSCCYCCYWACWPACAGAGGGLGTGTSYPCGPGSAIFYSFANVKF